MKPRIKQAEAKTPGGGTIALFEQDGAFSISFNGQELMHSKASASERLLGQIGVKRLEDDGDARILIGGLGLGFTLRSVLEAVSPETTVEVVELVPEVIEWNRVHLEPLNGALLDDPRVEVLADDVAALIERAEPETYDAILLDIDNGPIAMVVESNSSLYSISGIGSVHRALKPGGRVVFWSAGPDPIFEARLRKAGFDVTAVPAKTHEGAKRAAYLLYVADRS